MRIRIDIEMRECISSSSVHLPDSSGPRRRSIEPTLCQTISAPLGNPDENGTRNSLPPVPLHAPDEKASSSAFLPASSGMSQHPARPVSTDTPDGSSIRNGILSSGNEQTSTTADVGADMGEFGTDQEQGAAKLLLSQNPSMDTERKRKQRQNKRRQRQRMFSCACGSQVPASAKKRHFRTKKCQKFSHTCGETYQVRCSLCNNEIQWHEKDPHYDNCH